MRSFFSQFVTNLDLAWSKWTQQVMRISKFQPTFSIMLNHTSSVKVLGRNINIDQTEKKIGTLCEDSECY